MTGTGETKLLSLGRAVYDSLGLTLQKSYRASPKSQPMPAAEFNTLLAGLVRKKEPVMVSRLGVSEASVVLNWLEMESLNSASTTKRLHELFRGARDRWASRALDLLVNNAGFFPADEEHAARFAQTFLGDLALTDYLGVWGFVPGEQLLSGKYCPSAVQFEPAGVEPYYFRDPWSASLEGLRVLVVHPFAETIREQFRKRELLFPGGRILPDFDLQTVKAVQSLLGNARGHSSWFEALQSMKDDIDGRTFDIALIGAGAYGLPLAAHVKRSGKVAVHVGGALQILFGIKGRRWEAMPQISRFFNEAWVRPGAGETPDGNAKIEGGCYW